jgi:hypothetical protein
MWAWGFGEDEYCGGGGGARCENQSPDAVLLVDRCRGGVAAAVVVAAAAVVVVVVVTFVGDEGVELAGVVPVWFVDEVRGGIAAGDGWGLDVMLGCGNRYHASPRLAFVGPSYLF